MQLKGLHQIERIIKVENNTYVVGVDDYTYYENGDYFVPEWDKVYLYNESSEDPIAAGEEVFNFVDSEVIVKMVNED